MKLNRRRMMGATVGAAIAGPQMVRATAQQAPTLPFPAAYYGEAKAELTGSSPKDWTLSKLVKLKRIAAGDIRDEDRNYPTEGPPRPYEALRSVSENARHYMRARLYERQWRERTIAEALRALDEYDKTGILRSFL